jgi:hypothetical protein
VNGPWLGSGGGRLRDRRGRGAGALLALLAILIAGLLRPAAASALVAAPLPTVAATLSRSPVYVAPDAGPLEVDPAKLTPVLPKQTYFAALGRGDIPPGSSAEQIPAILSTHIGRGGTVIVLIDRTLYGASTLIPGQLDSDLQTAQGALPSNGDATPTLVSLLRSLSGPADVADTPPPSRAGGPVGGAVLLAILVAAVLGALALWWALKRPQRRRRWWRWGRPAKPAPVRDLVEIDYAGRILKRTPASERSAPRE